MLSDSVMSNTLQLHQASLFIGILQARIMEWVAMLSSRGSSQPVIKPGAPSLEVDSLPSEPPGKPQNTGVDSLFLLQGIFLTQESNWGLLHCRRILYQLSYQRNPKQIVCKIFYIFFEVYFICFHSEHFPSEKLW